LCKQGAQIHPVCWRLSACAQMRFAHLISATSGSGCNRCHKIDLIPTLGAGILPQNPLQKFSGESEVGTRRILKLLAIKVPVEWGEDGSVEEAFHLMAGIAWRNEIKSQLQHWLNQAINPLGSQPPGLGGNHAARANSEFPTDREDTSICRGHAVLRCRRWAGK